MAYHQICAQNARINAQYRAQMEADTKIWDVDHVLTDEQLAAFHDQHANTLLGEYDAVTAKQMAFLWRRRTWRNLRKQIERDIQRLHAFFVEFNQLRAKLRLANEKGHEEEVFAKRLAGDLQEMKSEGQNIVELQEQLNVQRKARKESRVEAKHLAKQLEVLRKKFELDMESRQDDLHTAIGIRHRDTEVAHVGHVLHLVSHQAPIVGGVARVAMASGSLIGFRSRQKKRNKAKKALDSALEEESSGSSSNEGEEGEGEEELPTKQSSADAGIADVKNGCQSRL